MCHWNVQFRRQERIPLQSIGWTICHHRLLQLLLQEFDGQRPDFPGGFLIAHAVIGVDESVTGIIDFDRQIFAAFPV